MDFSKDISSKYQLTQPPHSLYNNGISSLESPFKFNSLPTLKDLGILNLARVDPYFSKSHYNHPDYLGLSEELLSDELRSANQRRRRVSTHQKDILNRVFRQSFFPSTELRARLAQELEMTPRAVQIWFQNKRQAWRAKNKLSSHNLVAPQYIRTSFAAFPHRNFFHPYASVPFTPSKPHFYSSYSR